MSVHYKFKSNLNYDTVTFDGLHISVADLKKSIMHQKKIGKSSDFDLQITNAQTKEVYDNEDTLVPKNTSVVVARVPVTSGNKKNWEKPELPLPIDLDEPSGQIRFDKLVKSADLANANVTEDDKVKAMISQSSQEYDPSKYVKSRSMTGPLPPTYTCYRCGKQGHWIKNCPTNNPDVKRSTGIPRSFMVPVDGPEHKGALLTSSGEYAVPIIDHQAYKEVKKEKPPFVIEPEQAAEPDAKIPTELLCMFCKNLLQDAVLIPCCGNSFCDECVRQALLDSDNHECPICHEIDVSPDTVIPNRFLRTAVLNFKNETGYTRVRKLFQPPPPPPVETAHIESPQPSPDSTVETQPPPVETSDEKLESCEVSKDIPQENADVKVEKEDNQENIEETSELTQPGTPLADEPEDDMSHSLPIERVGHGNYESYSGPYSSHNPPESFDQDSRDTTVSDHGGINPIKTITNVIRKVKFPNRLPPLPPHQHYTSQGPRHHHDRAGDYDQRDRSDYHNRYERRNANDNNPGRAGVRAHSRYERRPHDSRYHSDNRREYRNDYMPDREQARDFDVHSTVEPPRRRPQYASPPVPAVHATYQVEVAPPYVPTSSVAPTTHQPPPLLPPPQATFPPQPPPPGASPIDNSSHIPPQPPPPGVGPLLPAPTLADSTSSNYSSQPFKSDESKVKTEERSIDDRIEAFQRELEKRGRESVRDHSSRSSSRSRNRNRSRSSSRSSHSRSYASSKSWTRSISRSISRSRSRSRSSYSSRRSRSRSFSRSRSRSRSKTRSFSRSPSRSRSKSRSRSRERERRRTDSRERLPTPFSRNHSTSHSPSPRNFHQRGRRSPYPIRRNYNPTTYNTTYTAPYTTAPSMLSLPAPYPPPPPPPPHIHSVHTIQPPPVSHPVDHYPQERRYQYTDQYPSYDVYQHQPKPFGHQRYEREQRNPRFEPHGYQRRIEEVHHRIPGWVGDRSRQEYKPRYRMQRDQQRKEIKELPKLPELDMSTVRIQKSDTRVKENKEEDVSVKKKDEKQVVKHKKHHHHRTKESKKTEKQEGRVPIEVIIEKPVETSNLIKVEVLPEEEVKVKKITSEQKVKSAEKKEKKHKHKKHKTGESGTKKKKVPKKEKSETGGADTITKVKTKKKKNKTKTSEEGKKKEKGSSKHAKQDVIQPEKEKMEEEDVPTSLVEEVKEDTKLVESAETELVESKSEPMEHDTQEAEIELPEEQALSEVEDGGIAPTVEGGYDQVAVGDTPDVPDATSPNDVEANEVAEGGGEEIEEEAEEEEIAEAEEIEENQVEDELHVEVPELSKWEREEYEDDALVRPQRKSAVVVPKEEKGLLSSDIIQRAEKVIMHKPLKTAIIVTSNKEKFPSKAEKASFKSDNENSSSSRTNKYKDQSESKTISPIEKPGSPMLQVTISTDKEKRSVQTKEGNLKEVPKVEPHSSKRVKLDRSNFSSIASDVKVPQVSSRTVVVEQWPNESKKLEKQKHDTEKGKLKNGESKHREKSSRRDDSSQSTNRNRDIRHKDHSKELKERRYDSGERRLRDSVDSHRISDRIERNKRNPSDTSSRERRYVDSRDSYRTDERESRDRHYRRSRSRSHGSAESYNSLTRKFHSRKQPDYDKGSSRHESHDKYSHRQKAARVSPAGKRESDKKSETKRESARDLPPSRSHTRQVYHDESKFEPNYDEFSDNDGNRDDMPSDKNKRSSSAAESSRKRLKHDQVEKTSSSHVSESKKDRKRTEKSSSPSSVTSSSPSGTDTSDAENKHKTKESDSDHKQRHKKSRHKKHKKHKHKHKKKKSHKSKQKD